LLCAFAPLRDLKNASQFTKHIISTGQGQDRARERHRQTCPRPWQGSQRGWQAGQRGLPEAKWVVAGETRRFAGSVLTLKFSVWSLAPLLAWLFRR
jgi:hypothetical protein